MENKSKKLLFKLSILFFILINFNSCYSLKNEKYKIDSLLVEANSYVEKSLFNESISIYDEILMIDSTNQRALYNKATIQNELNDSFKALNTIEKAVSLYPNNINNYVLKINIYTKLDDIEKVINTYEDLFKLYPYLYEERYNFNMFLISNFNKDNEKLIQLLYNNSVILLNNNYEIETALNGLLLCDESNYEYLTLLNLYKK